VAKNLAGLDMPTIANSAHSHATYAGLPTAAFVVNGSTAAINKEWLFANGAGALGKKVSETLRAPYIDNVSDLLKGEVDMAGNRRLVQVFIADPDQRVPLEQSMIYSGENKLTDLTDQELFFEVDIKRLLDEHNTKRTKIVDKSVKDRSEYLEPAKIRDLKMVVTTIAQF
jgi:hypothetical protein